MTSLESMIRRLLPLGVYDLSEGTNIRAELEAYAVALQAYREHIETALRECFISTSQSFGLEIRESVFGNIRSDYTTSQRRQMLILRKSFNDGDFTLDGFDRMIRSFGVSNYTILESPETYTVSIGVNDDCGDADRAWIIRQIALALPAQLNSNIYLTGSTFSELDSENMTFEVFDYADRTWSEIES